MSDFNFTPFTPRFVRLAKPALVRWLLDPANPEAGDEADMFDPEGVWEGLYIGDDEPGLGVRVVWLTDEVPWVGWVDPDALEDLEMPHV